MFNYTAILLTQTNCTNKKLAPFANKLGLNPNFDQENHFAIPLEKIFKNLIRIDIGKAYAERGVLEANKEIIEIVKKHSPKYLFWPTMTYEVLEETLHEIRKLGVFVITWFFDDEFRFEDYSRWWLPVVDYVFTVDKKSVQKYELLGAKVFHVIVTGEPENYSSSISKVKYEVSFVGSRNVADRDIYIKRLIEDGVSVSAFGSGWENGYVSHEEMIKIFANSKINICLTKSFSDTIKQLKGKIFDITMSGGFLLCEYVDEIEDYFEVGKEVICFSDYDDAIKKINYFLSNEEERKVIAEAGRLKAINYLAQHKLIENAINQIETIIVSSNRYIPESDLFLQMPDSIKTEHAKYHLRWAVCLREIGVNKKYWQDELLLSLKYDPFYTKNNFKFRNVPHIFYLTGKTLKKKIKQASGFITGFLNYRTIRNLVLKYRSLKNGIRIGKNIKFGKGIKLKLRYGGSICIGNNCEIDDGVIFETYGGEIVIGDNAYIGPYSVLYGHGNLIIGNNVLIAAHSVLIPANHSFEKNKTISEQEETRIGIIIEDDVWIGAGVKVLDGVKIARGCVIGASSLVNKSTEENSIYAGIPIRKIGIRK